MSGTIISLPILAGKKDQLEAVVSILEREVPSSYRKGIQIYCGGMDRHKLDSYEGTIRNIREVVPRSYSITWHAPFGLRNPNSYYNFIDAESKESLAENIAIAEELGARSVIVHLTTSFYHPDRQPDETNGGSYPKEYWKRYRWKPEWNDYERVKHEIIDVAYRHLREVANTTSMRIAVENMPLTLRGDISTKEEGLMYDPKLHTVRSIRDFLMQTNDLRNVGICLDTAHYELMRRTLGLVYSGDASLEEGRFIGVNYPEILGEQPPLEEFTLELFRTGRLYEVQLAGAGELWLKDTHVLGEGTDIAPETVQGKELLKVAKFIALHAPGTPISFDINEPGESPRKYLERPSQIRSLRSFFEYMAC